MTIKTIAIFAVATSLLAACGQAGPAPKSDGAPMPMPTVSTNTVDMPAGTQMSTLSMINAKIKLPMEGRPTSGYLTIENGGTAAETITAISSPDFGRVELHDHIKEGDLIRMVKLNQIDVPANSQVVFEQGGKHLMLFDATRALKNGESIKVTIVFSNSGPIETNFVVLSEMPLNAPLSNMDNMGAHDMSMPHKP